MDYSEFLTSSDFKDYNKKLTFLIAEHINYILKNSVHTEYLKGCLDLSKKILNLPLNLSSDDELNEVLNTDVKRNFASITAHLLREE